MSKKLIAVAAAAALALTGLVATPASATTISSVFVNTDNLGLNAGSNSVSHNVATQAFVPVTFMATRTL